MRSSLVPRCRCRVPPLILAAGERFLFLLVARLALFYSPVYSFFFSRWAHKHRLDMRITAGLVIFIGAFAAMAGWCLMDVEENTCAVVV